MQLRNWLLNERGDKFNPKAPEVYKFFSQTRVNYFYLQRKPATPELIKLETNHMTYLYMEKKKMKV